MPILAERTLMPIVSKADDQHLSLSVVPKRLKEGENAALTRPLRVTGAAEELDRDLVSPTHSSGLAARVLDTLEGVGEAG